MKKAYELENNCYTFSEFVKSVSMSTFREVKVLERIMNSEGLDRSYKNLFYEGYISPLCKQNDSVKTSFEVFFAKSLDKVDSHFITKRAVENCIAKFNSQKISTGHYATVIDRDMFSTMLSMMSSYFSAKNVFEKKSLFAEKLNQQIASKIVNLFDDSIDERWPFNLPFDSEGYTKFKVSLIENGILKNYLTNSEYAHRLDLPHTCSASRSPEGVMGISSTQLVLSAGALSKDDLLNRYDEVIYITEFTGGLHAGFKVSTGDFSLPAEGYLYRKGKKISFIDQFVVSGNILELMMNIDDVSNELSSGAMGSVCPDVLVKALSYAGE